MGPSGSRPAHLHAHGMPDSLDRDRKDFSLSVGRTMPLAREDGGDLIVIHAGPREGAVGVCSAAINDMSDGSSTLSASITGSR